MELQRSPSNVVGETESSELEMEVVTLDDGDVSVDPSTSCSSVDMHPDAPAHDIFNYRWVWL